VRPTWAPSARVSSSSQLEGERVAALAAYGDRFDLIQLAPAITDIALHLLAQQDEAAAGYFSNGTEVFEVLSSALPSLGASAVVDPAYAADASLCRAMVEVLTGETFEVRSPSLKVDSPLTEAQMWQSWVASAPDPRRWYFDAALDGARDPGELRTSRLPLPVLGVSNDSTHSSLPPLPPSSSSPPSASRPGKPSSAIECGR
jgi:hypothetical protein